LFNSSTHFSATHQRPHTTIITNIYTTIVIAVTTVIGLLHNSNHHRK